MVKVTKNRGGQFIFLQIVCTLERKWSFSPHTSVSSSCFFQCTLCLSLELCTCCSIHPGPLFPYFAHLMSSSFYSPGLGLDISIFFYPSPPNPGDLPLCGLLHPLLTHLTTLNLSCCHWFPCPSFPPELKIWRDQSLGVLHSWIPSPVWEQTRLSAHIRWLREECMDEQKF